VAEGFVVQRYSPLVVGVQSRLQAENVWEVLNFLLNGLVFILIGLQLHPIFLSLAGSSLPHLIWEGIAVSLAAILVRIIRIFVGGTLVRRLDSHREDHLSLGEEVVIAWAGMRGVVSLAAAQALPINFPHRDLILFLTFSVILTTLVVQGLSLPFFIRSVGLAEGDAARREEMRARLAATEAALARLDSRPHDGVSPEVVEDLRQQFQTRAHLEAADGGDAIEHRARVQAYDDLQRDLLRVQRRTIINLRDRGEINDETLRRIQRELDLEEMHLGAKVH
jgi:CPA1 family monovalent cation:H+ antiporter